MLPTSLLSLSAKVGWWAVANQLDRHVGLMAKAAGYAQPEQWGPWASLIYTVSAHRCDRPARLHLPGLCRLARHRAGDLSLAQEPGGGVGRRLRERLLHLGCAYSWMAIYPSELFTSTVRSTAVSFIFNATRLIAWVFPILAGTMIQFFGGLAHTAATLGLCYVVGLVIPWFLPETKGKPLPG